MQRDSKENSELWEKENSFNNVKLEKALINKNNMKSRKILSNY